MLRTALSALYSPYEGEFERWQLAGIGVPPVFIVVCQNTAISKLVFEWIAGFERGDAEARATSKQFACVAFRRILQNRSANIFCAKPESGRARTPK